MLNISVLLKKIQSFLQTALEEHNFLMLEDVPDDDDDTEGKTKLVYPKVYIGNFPHENFAFFDTSSVHFAHAPYILIGYRQRTLNDDGETMSVLIQACSYVQQAYEYNEGDILYPDNMGILDVSTLLESVARWLEDESDIPLSRPFKIGSYNTHQFTYPYAFGFLEFELEDGLGVLNNSMLLEA